MNKAVFKYMLVFVALFFLGYYPHFILVEYFAVKLSFSLQKIYIFHAIFSALICINLRVIATFERFFSQLGFIYLSTLVLKLILFALFFYDPLFTVDYFSVGEKVSLFFPLFIFLWVEAVFVLKILNQKD
jgi:hypothetical protein